MINALTIVAVSGEYSNLGVLSISVAIEMEIGIVANCHAIE
jgi:hypothetical protein